MGTILSDLLLFDRSLEDWHGECDSALLAREAHVNFELAVVVRKQTRLWSCQTLHVFLAGFLIKAHVIGYLSKSELIVVIEEVEDAHLVCADRQVVLISRWKFTVDNSRAHCKVPIQLPVVVLWLVLVEHGEVLHASVDLEGN